MSVRLATTDPADVADVARLLHDFNTEFATPTPGATVLAGRLERLLSGNAVFAVLAGRPAIGVAVVSLRPNVWFDGPVALLDELYVAPDHRSQGIGGRMLGLVRQEAARRGAELLEINVDEGDTDARRFYERHGFTDIEPDSGERALYYQGPVVP